jgi:hypothetical protein
MRWWFVPVAMTVGCACDNVVVSTEPAQGATGVLANASLTATMTAPDPDVTVTLTDDAGAAVPGTLAIDSTTVVFTPDAPLNPSTAYTFDIDNCSGTTSVAFTTGALGTPVDDPASLVGGTYVIEFGTARVTNPPRVQDLIDVLYTDFAIAASVQAVGDGSADMMLAYVEGEPYEQDLCSATLPLDPFAFTNPWFELNADGASLRFSVGDVPMETLRMSGAFTADGQALEELYVHLVFDTRPIVPSIDPDPDASPSLACDFMGAVGVPCVECASGAGTFCADIEMYGVSAHRITPEMTSWDADDVATQTCE